MTSITKKTLTFATLLLMTSGGTWAGTNNLRLGDRAFDQNKKSRLTGGMDDDQSKTQKPFLDKDLDDGYVSRDEFTPPPPVSKIKTLQDFEPNTGPLTPTRIAPPPPSQDAQEKAAAAKKKEAALQEAAKKKEAALQEAARKKAEADIKAAQEKNVAKRETALKKADASAEEDVKKELDYFIKGPSLFERIKENLGFRKKKLLYPSIISGMYKSLTEYLMTHSTIKQQEIFQLLLPQINHLSGRAKNALEKIIDTDTRAITSKWVYEGNKNFTPKNAAVYAVRLSLSQGLRLKNQRQFYNPYMEHFKKILFEGEGHKNFRKHLINELKKQIQKNDTLRQYFLDIHPELKPQTSTDRQNLETFNDIMCNAGTKIFVGFSPKQNKPSKKQQWAEALLQSKDYKPTVAQRIFRQLTPLENILIQSMVDLAKNGSISNLNDQILWLSGLKGDKIDSLKGDKIDSLKNDKIDNILGHLYKKIHAHNKGKILSQISPDAKKALDDVPDVKKGMQSKS